MTLSSTFSIAARALARNAMRTFLTMLGLIIGVGAVITMLALGNGARTSIQASIASLGTNTIMISSGSVNSGGVRSGAFGSSNLTVEDAEALASQADSLAYVAPMTQNSSQVVFQNQNWFTSVQGTSPDFVEIRNWPVETGQFFTATDVRSAAKVCVLGRTVATELFADEEPIGQTVRIGRVPFRVVGVLSVKGEAAFGQNQDDLVVVPYSTAMKRLFNQNNLRNILASAQSEEAVPTAVAEITDILKVRHRIRDGQEEDFSVRTQAEFAQTAAESTRVFTMLLGGIASVSLLVGGIGIMNIMLVSVTERIREIGIRMAVGARGRDILQQFLVEAILLSVVGGAAGVGLGFLLAKVGASFSQWKLVVSPQSVLLAFG
ncbi:MAG: ABC transporter permease, partial [Candidatus Eremiobacteraeota bacterium]|nr:ABC transporter permease [Candidatus Eremiobacteraeota bacterium]